MKKTILLATSITVSMMVFAQQHKEHSKVPESVRTSWQSDYPNNKDDHNSWDMRNNQWHTRYKDKDHGNRYVDVYYDKNGHRIRSKSLWNRNDLPEAVRDRMNKKYHVHNYQAYRIDRPEKGVVFQLSWGKTNVYIDESGNEVKY